MTSETAGHPTPHPDAPTAHPPQSDPGSERELEGHESRPMPPDSSASNDELTSLLSESLTTIKPDPFLGEFSQDPPTSPAPAEDHPSAARFGVSDQSGESFDAIPDPTPLVPAEGQASGAPSDAEESGLPPPIGEISTTGSPENSTDTPKAPGFRRAASGPAVAAPSGSSLDLFPAAGPPEIPPESASFDAFSALDLGAPPSARTAPLPPDDQDEDDEAPSRGSSLLVFLLFSYASAVTFGLIWVLVSGRKLREADEGDVPAPADTRPDPGLRAEQSRKVTPPPPVAADHLTTLGKPIRVGLLEATPLAVSSGSVTLTRAFKTIETRDGGEGALRLRIRLKNLSTDTIFAPLDEAFLRERGGDVLDSAIETAGGGEITMFPLAVTSEWSIDGQEFRELRPGESFDAEVVSAPDVAGRLSPEMTWRIRLRTGIDRTDSVGVRFSKDEIRPGA